MRDHDPLPRFDEPEQRPALRLADGGEVSEVPAGAAEAVAGEEHLAPRTGHRSLDPRPHRPHRAADAPELRVGEGEGEPPVVVGELLQRDRLRAGRRDVPAEAARLSLEEHRPAACPRGGVEGDGVGVPLVGRAGSVRRGAEAGLRQKEHVVAGEGRGVQRREVLGRIDSQLGRAGQFLHQRPRRGDPLVVAPAVGGGQHQHAERLAGAASRNRSPIRIGGSSTSSGVTRTSRKRTGAATSWFCSPMNPSRPRLPK
jgi:hypothetical protein